MPRAHRQLKNPKRKGLTYEQTDCLLLCKTLIGSFDAKSKETFGSLEAARAAWFENREYVLSLAEKELPGEKCWAEKTWGLV